MAIRLKDMDDEETIHLTKAMAISGETLTDLMAAIVAPSGDRQAQHGWSWR